MATDKTTLQAFVLLVGLGLSLTPSGECDAQPTSPLQERARAIEDTALKSLTDIIPGVRYEAVLDSTSPGSYQIEAEFAALFEEKRIRLKQRHRNRRSLEMPFGEWQGPTFTIVKDDVVLSRNATFEHGTFLHFQYFYPDLYASKHTFWPQFIGTALCGVWQMPEKSPRGFLGRDDRTVQSIEEEQLDGLETTRVDYKQADGYDVSVWYSPTQNGLIVRMLASARSNTGVFEKEVRTQLKEWAPGVWFPEKSVMIRKLGGEVLDNEVIEITSFEVIKTTDEMFGPAGLELPLGGIVSNETTGKEGGVYQKWTNAGLQDMTKEEESIAFPIPKEDEAPPSVITEEVIAQPWWRSRFTIVFAVNVIVVLLLIGLFRFRKRVS